MEETTTTIDDSPTETTPDFDDAIESVDGGLSGVEGDLCGTVGVLLTPTDLEPETPEQVRSAVDSVTRLLEQLAALEQSDPAGSAALTAVAAEIRSQAEASDYSADGFSGDATQQLLEGQELTAAITGLLEQAVEQCDPAIFGESGLVPPEETVGE